MRLSLRVRRPSAPLSWPCLRSTNIALASLDMGSATIITVWTGSTVNCMWNVEKGHDYIRTIDQKNVRAAH